MFTSNLVKLPNVVTVEIPQNEVCYDESTTLPPLVEFLLKEKGKGRKG